MVYMSLLTDVPSAPIRRGEHAGNGLAPAAVVAELRSIALFEDFPEFLDGLSASERAHARRIRARVVVLDRGPWEPAALRLRAHSHFGFLILDGAMLRRVQLGERSAGELLGCGDLVQPWEQGSPYDSIVATPGWELLDRTRLAVLDAGFATRVAPYPQVAAALITRASERARMLAFQHVASHIPSLDDRLLALMWAFADRWGHVTPEGIAIRLRLTHATLAELAGASRPSVSTALGRLARAGTLRRMPTGWMLNREAACEGVDTAGDARMQVPCVARSASG
jgi:CRP-like cAMP-binding protein